ncbi:MAG: hypothetical protein K8W52_21825 [Deltaproteobacteria bacterium]|nr:hypothetical protein [Deltaproteobacteria bacterium]
MAKLRTIGIAILGVGLVASAGCKKKKADDGSGSASGGSAASGAGGAGGGGTASGGSGAGTDTTSNAGSGAVAALKPVSDCPKTLTGNDTGLDRTIKKECGTVVVDGDYSVEGQLTIEAGVKLEFRPGASMNVGYNTPTKLIIKGTAQEPVTFTSGGDKVAAAWKGVHLYANAARSTIDGLVLEFGDNGQGALLIDAIDVAITNTTIRDAKEFGLYVGNEGSITGGTGLTFERAGKIAASFPANGIGGLGAGNTFKDGFVQIRPGVVDTDATWKNPGAYYLVEGGVDVNGKNTRSTLTIEAGAEFRFKPDGYLEVGYNTAAAVVVKGTKDKPVVLRGDADGEWRGIGTQANGELTIEGATVTGGGQDDDHGAVYAKAGTLTVKDVAFAKNKIGLTATADAKLKAVTGASFDGKAWKLAPDQIGALDGTNTYAAGAIGEIINGTVAHDQTWVAQAGAEVHVSGDVGVEGGTLTIGPGVELRFDNCQLQAGYGAKGTLKIVGSADKPVVLRGLRDEKDAWTGVVFNASSNDNVIENAQIKDVSGDTAVTVHGAIKADLKNVTFKRVAAGVGYDCDSKVTQAGLKMDGGGKPEKKPSC